MLVDVLGWVGTSLVLAAYTFNALGKIKLSGWQYPAMNIAGGAGLIVNALSNNAWPLVALNAVWIVVGAVGLFAFARKRAPEPLT
jgi:hypothetical protein